MFKCKVCEANAEYIKFLEGQVKDLQDRLMSFASDAYIRYKAENNKGELLYPKGIDETGKEIDYSKIDLAKLEDETFRAFGEEPITVEDEVR